MWPLTRKSYTSMIAMQKMQPELQRVQKLYANDKARMQMEMMRIYQTHKTSPMSGCLPMLIQIPIFFALYKALLISVQMRNAHFLWISDLATMDPYFILPILMGATMWLQQYLQANKTDTSNPNDIAAQTAKTSPPAADHGNDCATRKYTPRYDPETSRRHAPTGCCQKGSMWGHSHTHRCRKASPTIRSYQTPPHNH